MERKDLEALVSSNEMHRPKDNTMCLKGWCPGCASGDCRYLDEIRKLNTIIKSKDKIISLLKNDVERLLNLGKPPQRK